MASVGHPRGFGSDPPNGLGRVRGSPQIALSVSPDSSKRHWCLSEI